MFRKLLTLFFLLTVAAAATSWLAAQPGVVKIEWLGWRMELPTSLAVALVFAFGLLLVGFDRLFRTIVGIPGWLGGQLRQRRFNAGHRALTLGFLAVSAGEPAQARKYASRAERLMSSPQLTGLLAAQASHLSGDHQAARRYFNSLLNDSETAFLGHIGLMRLAIEDQDTSKAHDSARAALEIKPTSVLAARQLLYLEARQANWQAALPALDVISKAQKKSKNKSSNSEQVRNLSRHRCALEFLRARDLLASDRQAAIGALGASLKIDQGFLPALITLADLYLNDESYVKAAKTLERGFQRTPHTAIVERLKKAWKSNDGQFIARLVKLLKKVDKKQHRLAYHIVAEQARTVGLDGEAERLLCDGNNTFRKVPTTNSATDIDEAKLPDDARPLWQCLCCKNLNEDWEPFCPVCDEFASLEWRCPIGATPIQMNL